MAVCMYIELRMGRRESLWGVGGWVVELFEWLVLVEWLVVVERRKNGGCGNGWAGLRAGKREGRGVMMSL